ncbi:SH3-domain-containing protein [Microthyrium microscopicum]|uniref:SH3-domain-containing protein n=1 Tax=Microthyrium microscopicum TaxID=703497 RepID=A0A6A6UV22_9PEZI|nr:SH3-domain-containing protein [Microthyrium microscopicum]
MGYEEFSVSMTNRSLRTVKAELEFLADNDVISRSQLSTMLSQLPTETTIHAGSAPTNNIALPVRSNGLAANHNNNSYNEKVDTYQQQQPAYNAPPAYNPTPSPAPPPPAPAVLCRAVALYNYPGTDAGDLPLDVNDHVSVLEYTNQEWWKGKSERTGQVGIFPRSYVRLDEANKGPAPSTYGNAPMDVAQGAQPVAETGEKKNGFAKKAGGKLGNAALFGAGATIGSNIVNSIF